MRVGILTNMPTPYRSGMWRAYSEINDVDLTIFYCTNKENDRYWEVEKTAEVKEIFLSGHTFFNTIHVNFNILRYFRENDAWIIGGYNSITNQILIILCNIYKIPYILMVDGVNPQKLSNKDNLVIYMLKRFYIKNQFMALANGTSGKEIMKKYGLSEDRIINQYLTVDVNRFLETRENDALDQFKIRKMYDLNDNDIILLYVGRLVRDKGIQDLISASKELKKEGFPIKVLIVGEGVFRKELEKINNGDEDVIFCGEVSYAELPGYYISSDIFILPTYEDVWGLTINEAMACGLPIVTTRSAGAYMDMIKGNGHVYDAGDVKGLICSIKMILGVNVYDDSDEIYEVMKKNIKDLGAISTQIVSKYTFLESQQSFQRIVDVLQKNIYQVNSKSV